MAGVRVGMKTHTLVGEVLEVVEEAGRVGADLIVTLGGGGELG